MNYKKMNFKGQELIISVNDKYNFLTIIKMYYRNGKLNCTCICDCGKIKENIIVRNLLTGNTKSCGCYNNLLMKERIINQTKHGCGTRKSRTKLYKKWLDMRKRCNNPNTISSKNYYKKGIKVCDEWNDFNNFKKWAISTGYKDGLTIERKDNSKNYCPENCTWISKSEQSKNRTTIHYITYNNKTQSLTDWSKEKNVSRSTIYNYLKKGKPLDEIF